MYQFNAEAKEMQIDGEIDAYWGANLRYMNYDLYEAKDVVIYLNSGGGQVTEGFAIADRLRRHAQNNTVEVVVCGLCASIATMVHAAGSKGSRKMTANSFYMIHNTAVWAEGGSKDLRSLADVLDTMSDRIAENYVDVIESNSKLINGSREETKAMIIAMMDAETWLSAEQALKFGLIDAIVEAKTFVTPDNAPAIKNQIRNFTNIPAELMAELNNNITAEEKTLFQKFMAFCGLAPKSECMPEEKKPIENLENPSEMTNEEMIEKLKAAGYTVEVEEEVETEEVEKTEEEMLAELEATGVKMKKVEAKATAPVTAEAKLSAEIKALKEEIARNKQGDKKPKVTAEIAKGDEKLSRKEKALNSYVAENTKTLEATAKAMQKKFSE